MEDINKLIECEEISEIILGNRLRREQLNFLFETTNIIYNSPGRRKLFETDKKKMKMINLSIPQLTILKSLERMHEIYTTKLKELIDPSPFERRRLL